MNRPRRHDAAAHEPRIEMTPLLDVIFLLMTFFILSLVVSVRAQILPIQLPQLTTGETARDVKIAGVTVDTEGRIFLNREELSAEQLEAKLSELAALDHPPVFYLAIDDAPSRIDRGPILIDMIERFRRVGIHDLNIVGSRDTNKGE